MVCYCSSVPSYIYWWLEISHGGNGYSMEIGNHYRTGLGLLFCQLCRAEVSKIPVKGRIVSIFSLIGCVISIAPVQLCGADLQTAIDNM